MKQKSRMRQIGAMLVLSALSTAHPSAIAGELHESNQEQPSSVMPSGVKINMRNVDIHNLISLVSRVTGLNFVVDPRVHGKVTVISSTQMSEEALYQVFLTVLSVNGYAAVPAGNIIKIIPSTNARENSLLHGSGAEVVTHALRLRNMPATELVPILRPLIAQQGFIAAYPANNMLILTGRAENIARIVRLVHKLDRPSDTNIRIVKLRYASAQNISRILDKLLANSASQNTEHASQIRIAADTSSNSLLVYANPAGQQRVRALIESLDTPTPTAGDSHVVFLKYADANSLAKLLKSVVDTSAATAHSGKGANIPASTNIVADESINALIITGPEQRAQGLSELARQLDVRPAEVLIEAVIAEVSGDLAKQLGTQIGVLPSGNSNSGTAAATDFTNGAISLTTLASNPASVGPGLLLGLGNLNSGQTRYGLLLNALRSNTGTDILSTPSLLTLDNQKAEIVVGKNVPFITGSYSVSSAPGTGASTLSSPFQTIERKNVGITLKVTPQINQGNNLRLNISLNVSSLAPSVAGAADLITNTRQIKTSVITSSGSIIVLGGLIDDSYQTSTQKVPLLGNIPGLGILFSSRSRQRTKTNLMIFLHPVIIDTQAAAERYTLLNYGKLRNQQRLLNTPGELAHGQRLPHDLKNLLLPRPPASLAPRDTTSPDSLTPHPRKSGDVSQICGFCFGS